MSHRIRLRGPWQAVRGEATEPFTWPPAPEQLAADSLCRRFQRPTGLTQESSVRLVLQCSVGAGAVTLNGRELGRWDSSDAEWEIGSRLQASNLLELFCEGVAPVGVCLELD